jgi:hypothetical protein
MSDVNPELWCHTPSSGHAHHKAVQRLNSARRLCFLNTSLNLIASDQRQIYSLGDACPGPKTGGTTTDGSFSQPLLVDDLGGPRCLLAARYGRFMRDPPTMFARIGVMRALNRHVERVFNPSRKEHHWGRRKLARDR